MDDDKQILTDTKIDNTYRLNSWMTDLGSYIGRLRIGELSLASAHNSGMDLKAPYSNTNATCQDDSFRHQLDNGVRVLDIRFMWYFGYGADNINLGLRFHHGSSSGRTFSHMMIDVDEFQRANPGEIIILDFHKIEPQRNDRPVPYEAIHAHFLRHYTYKLLPRSAVHLTLDQIKQQCPGPRMIVAVPDEVLEKRDATYFWSKINHVWHGNNGISIDGLRSFIDRALPNASPLKNSLWSMSATTYAWAAGPMNIVDYLRSWYPTGSDWQNKSNIINFDWCTRSSAGMIRQCIESNKTKVPVNGVRILSPVSGDRLVGANPLVTGTGIPGATVTLYKTWDVNWGSGLVDSQGEWKIASRIPVGEIRLQCKQSLDGYDSEYSQSVIFTIDPIPVPKIEEPAHGSVITTTLPLIKGRGLPGATVRFVEGGLGTILYGTALVREDGQWEGRPQRALPARRFPLACNQVLLDGRPSGYAESTFTIYDGMPRPEIRTPEEGLTYYALRPLLIGTGVSGATLLIGDAITSELFGAADVGVSGSWEVKPFKDLPGTCKLSAVQILGEVISLPADTITFYIKAHTPVVLVPANNVSISLPYSVVGLVFAIHPGAIIKCLVNSREISSHGQIQSGIWGVNLDEDVPLGDITLSFYQIHETSGIRSLPSEPITVTVLGRTVESSQESGPPKNLKVKPSTHSADMSWRSPGADVVSYAWSLDDHDEQVTFETNVKAENLLPDRPYIFNVCAINDAGVRSAPTQQSFATSYIQNCPRDFRVVTNAGGILVLAWEPPNDGLEKLLGYRFSVLGMKIDLSRTTYTINNLSDGTPVMLEVQSLFSDGESTWERIVAVPKM